MIVSLNLNSTTFGKQTFQNVVDDSFTQFSQPEVINNEVSIEEFFKIFDDVFYNIPKYGNSNSHQVIYDRVSEYLGVQNGKSDITDLLDEVTTLKTQLVDSFKDIEDLSLT